jgi:hypothetical protein
MLLFIGGRLPGRRRQMPVNSSGDSAEIPAAREIITKFHQKIIINFLLIFVEKENFEIDLFNDCEMSK